MPKPDTSLLTAALVGYVQQKGEIEAKIAEIKKQLGGRSAQVAAGEGGDIPSPFAKPSRRGKMSAAARKRIAAAQRKRWAAYRTAKHKKRA
jgi:hypothetical protein